MDLIVCHMIYSSRCLVNFDSCILSVSSLVYFAYKDQAVIATEVVFIDKCLALLGYVQPY